MNDMISMNLLQVFHTVCSMTFNNMFLIQDIMLHSIISPGVRSTDLCGRLLLLKHFPSHSVLLHHTLFRYLA